MKETLHGLFSHSTWTVQSQYMDCSVTVHEGDGAWTVQSQYMDCSVTVHEGDTAWTGQSQYMDCSVTVHGLFSHSTWTVQSVTVHGLFSHSTWTVQSQYMEETLYRQFSNTTQ